MAASMRARPASHIIGDSIRKAVKPSPEFHTQSEGFVPEVSLEEILSPENVEDILHEIYEHYPNRPSITLDAIFSPKQVARRVKILATLLHIEQTKRLHDFIAYNVWDADLPLLESSGILNTWSGRLCDEFIRIQYLFLAPVIDFECMKHKVFQSSIRMPFLDALDGSQVGAYGQVSKVRIHPDYQRWGNRTGFDDRYAVKRFTADTVLFKHEREALLRFSFPNPGHESLIQLLYSYELRSTNYLIFPCAEGDLQWYWQNHEADSTSLHDQIWMLQQCHGIASGLERVHNNPSFHIQGEVDKGRHGDIKPKNILFFKDEEKPPGRLVVADFALARFHSSKADYEPMYMVAYSRTYRPPEKALDGERNVSQKYDIWTLGCVFLEFVTWYLLGSDAVNPEHGRGFTAPDGIVREDFCTSRQRDDDAITGHRDDKFFNLSYVFHIPSVVVKPSVLQWIKYLRCHQHSTQALHAFLDLIQDSMLIPMPEDRSSMLQVTTALGRILSAAKSRPTYCQPVRKSNFSYKQSLPRSLGQPEEYWPLITLPQSKSLIYAPQSSDYDYDILQEALLTTIPEDTAVDQDTPLTSIPTDAAVEQDVPIIPLPGDDVLDQNVLVPSRPGDIALDQDADRHGLSNTGDPPLERSNSPDSGSSEPSRETSVFTDPSSGVPTPATSLQSFRRGRRRYDNRQAWLAGIEERLGGLPGFAMSERSVTKQGLIGLAASLESTQQQFVEEGAEGSQTSLGPADDNGLQFIDSRGLVSEILRSLRVGFDPTLFQQRGLSINDQDLSSGLRQVLEDYCAEFQGAKRHNHEAYFPKSPQSHFFQQVHSMLLGEIDFLVEQLLLICQGEADHFAIEPPPESFAKARDPKVETVPALDAIDFLMGGKAFGRLRLRIRRLLKQDIMDIISDEVLLILPLTAPGLYTADFHVSWDLFDYIASDLDGFTDISQVLTLSGTGLNAYASCCADYIKWLWPESDLMSASDISSGKYDICSHIEQYLKEKNYENPDSTLMIRGDKKDQNSITVTMVGSEETIVKVAQQLAWLTAAFRSRVEGVALSEVDFVATEGMQFFIEAGALIDASAVTSGPDICWHRLVRNAAVAHGFPTPPRFNLVGLELPYAAMLKLSQVSTFLVANKRLAFYGFSSFLFPMSQFSEKTESNQGPQCIQWHFETSDDRQQYFDGADYLAESKCSWANDVHERTLAKSRHFVGYCRVSEFRLATSTSNFLNLLETPMPDASTTVGARVENVTAGTGGLGFGTLEFETNIRYAHNIVNAVAADEYLGAMDTIERMSMILWDCGDECGWLVPAQALLLHMAHVWVKSKGIAANFRYASRGPGYLQEVDKILREDRKKVLRKEGRDDDSDFELRHLIMRFWNDIRGCMMAQQSALHEDKGVLGYQSGGISGWEVTDFLTRPPLEFSLKQDKRGPSDKSWNGLAVDKNIPVLFCKGVGEVIGTTPSGLLCSNCNISLKHQGYLIASLACLKLMAQRYGGFKPKTRLTAEWGWQPTDQASLFQEHCQFNVGARCNERLQKLIAVKEEQQGTSLNLPTNGVVVFGRACSKTLESVATVTPTTPITAFVGKAKIIKWLARLRDKKRVSL